MTSEPPCTSAHPDGWAGHQEVGALLCCCRAATASHTYSPCRILQQEPPAASLPSAHTHKTPCLSTIVTPNPLVQPLVMPAQKGEQKAFHSFYLRNYAEKRQSQEQESTA